MLALYMVCGVCFFIYLSVKITPRFAKKAILEGLKGEAGKEIMKAILVSALQSMDEEIDIPGEPDDAGNPTLKRTTIGAHVVGTIASSVVHHFKMTFLGEKGHISQELRGAATAMALENLPPQYRSLGALFEPLMRKYPAIGALVGIGTIMYAQNGLKNSQSSQSPQSNPTGNMSALTYRGV